MIYFVAISLHSQVSFVTVFNGLNFFEWSEQVKIQEGVLDLDLLLLEEKLVITIDNIEEEKSKFKAWERSNKLSLMFMRMTIANNIKTIILQT